MGDNLRDIPEFIEREMGESLQARLDALGKPNLRLYCQRRRNLVLYSQLYNNLANSHRPFLVVLSQAHSRNSALLTFVTSSRST